MSTEAGDRPSPLRVLQEHMRDVAARVRAVDIRSFEVEANHPSLGELQRTTGRLVGDASDLVSRVLAHCESASRSTATPSRRDSGDAILAAFLPFERAIDATVAATKPGSRKAIEEVAFMAQLELRQRGERLERVSLDHGALVLLGECDSSLRRVRKALAAVDAAIARAEEVPALLDFTSELNTSLAVRRAYAKLRMRILDGDEPTSATIHARLRRLGTLLAIVVGWDVYPEMRVRDRLLLRELQRRVLDWLRTGAELADGLRLWRDVASSVEMFALVNRRQELQEHDRKVLGEAIALLGPRGTPLPVELPKRLAALEGLDAELDAALARVEQTPADTLRGVVVALGERIGLEGAWAEEPPSW